MSYLLLFIIYGALKDVQRKMVEIAQAHAVLRYDVENMHSGERTGTNLETVEEIKNKQEP